MDYLEALNKIVWGIPTLLLIIGVGAYLSVRTKFAQLRLLPSAVKAFFEKLRQGDGGTSFQALCTALAATVGTGNIVGVAGAIAIGGPGSVFWMWVCAIFGMITKYAEALLAVCYRIKDGNGNYSGGPMHIIETGLGRKWRPMALCYSLLGIMAAFGIGNATQVNAVVGSINSVWELLGREASPERNLLIGGLLGSITVVALSGGARRIGSIAEMLVPLASAAYLVLCLGALVRNAAAIPEAIKEIMAGVFHPHAVTGGAVGSALTVLRVGAARGVFTNEAGMGTAAIAHGTSNVKHPAEQGLMGIMEVFLDTILICTMTALVILTSGVEISYGSDLGVLLTTDAFSQTYGRWVSIPIALFLSCFAVATIFGWGYYGLECTRYAFGAGAVKWFVILQGFVAVLSAVMKTGDIWLLAELFNGLMAIPNMIAVGLLSGTVAALTKTFIQEENRIPASGKSLPKGNRWRHAHCRGHGSQESFHR